LQLLHFFQNVVSRFIKNSESLSTEGPRPSTPLTCRARVMVVFCFFRTQGGLMKRLSLLAVLSLFLSATAFSQTADVKIKGVDTKEGKTSIVIKKGDDADESDKPQFEVMSDSEPIAGDPAGTKGEA